MEKTEDKSSSQKRNSKLKIEYTKPGFLLHSFQSEIGNDAIFFQVIKMLDSVYIWIGNKQTPILQNLALAMNNKFDSQPICTKLFGDEMETNSKNIASRLCKKLNKAVYLSFNVEETKFNVPVIEKKLNKEITDYPDKF